MNAGFSTAQVAVIGALAVHQVSKTWDNGLHELGHNYAPVFAVQMSPRLTASFQILSLPLSLIAAILLPGAPGRWISVGFVVCWLLSLQRRMANHVLLGFASVLAFAIAPGQLDPAIARDLLAGVYISAALFKMNGEYLFSDRSAAKVVSVFYFNMLGLRPTRSRLKRLPFGVIAVEFATGLLLCIPHGFTAALLLAIIMHAAFGASGNFPFSIVALSLWAIAGSPRGGYIVLPAISDGVWLVVPLTALLSLTLSRTSPGPRSFGYITKDAVQGTIYGVLCVSALAARAISRYDGPSVAVVNWVIGAIFFLNFGLVFLGLKLDWSFAMFSSLRPFGRSWLQRGGRDDWPRYYLLTLPDRLPKRVLRSVAPSFLYQSTRGTHVVHEAVVYRLEALARQSGITFSPTHVVPNKESGELVISSSQASPRRTVLLFPAIIPKKFSQHYLG